MRITLCELLEIWISWLLVAWFSEDKKANLSGWPYTGGFAWGKTRNFFTIHVALVRSKRWEIVLSLLFNDSRHRLGKNHSLSRHSKICILHRYRLSHIMFPSSSLYFLFGNRRQCFTRFSHGCSSDFRQRTLAQFCNFEINLTIRKTGRNRWLERRRWNLELRKHWTIVLHDFLSLRKYSPMSSRIENQRTRY